MKKIKIIAIVLAAVLLMPLLAGCGNKAPAEQTSIKSPDNNTEALIESVSENGTDKTEPEQALEGIKAESDEPVMYPDEYLNTKWAYDASGILPTDVWYFDMNGEPAMCLDGYHHMKWTYDTSGGISDEWYYGLNEEPVLCSYGYYHLKQSYDDSGTIPTDIWFYDINEEPVISSDGFHHLQIILDEFGNEIESLYFDAYGNTISH